MANETPLQAEQTASEQENGPAQESPSEQGSSPGKDAEGPDRPRAQGHADTPLPKPTFSTFVLSLASSALVQLGEVAEPETGKKQENLQLAKHTIDILSMLQEKIEKGLDDGEKRLMEGILYELRMKYVVKKQ
jgi:Domain of unknown function (DUF1844).